MTTGFANVLGRTLSTAESIDDTALQNIRNTDLKFEKY